MIAVRATSRNPRLHTQPRDERPSQQGQHKPRESWQSLFRETSDAQTPGSEPGGHAQFPRPPGTNGLPAAQQQQQQRPATTSSRFTESFRATRNTVSQPNVSNAQLRQHEDSYDDDEADKGTDFQDGLDNYDSDYDNVDSLDYDSDDMDDDGEEDGDDDGGLSGLRSESSLMSTRRAELARMAARNNAAYGRRWRQSDVREYMLKRAKLESGRKRRGKLPPDDALPRPHTFPKLPRTLQMNICEWALMLGSLVKYIETVGCQGFQTSWRAMCAATLCLC